MSRLLLFGANGAIGSAIAEAAARHGMAVIGASRQAFSSPQLAASVVCSGTGTEADVMQLAQHAPYAAVCWAQGANGADSVYDVNIDKHRDIYQANCLYILATLKPLLAQDLLEKPARMVVISSIWQHVARQDKLSYTMSKAALLGLVQAGSIDLAKDGHLINAVLPGVLDTPMTRANLSAEQVARVENATAFKRLATPDDVAELVCFLCSKYNNSITGQSIAVDLGFSHAHCI